MIHGATPNPQHTTTDTALQKGDYIGRTFEIHEILGKGGFGIVYLVYAHDTQSVLALKTFRDKYLKDASTRERFRREANVWVNLDRHPHLVRAYLVVEIAGRLYIGMEYIAPNEQGLNSLDGYLKNQPPDLAQSLRWAIQCCYGMEHAYSKGIRSHRDIKPKNIMIGQDKTAKITDFGLAGILNTALTVPGRGVNTLPDGVEALDQTQDGDVFGTLTYMSPEQFSNSSACDERSDVYSLGIVLYQMATGGQKPFQAARRRDGSKEERKRYREDTQRLHRESPVPRLDSPLFPIIQRCLEKELGQRYATFRDLRLDLEALLKSEAGKVITLPGRQELEAWEWGNKGCSLQSLGHFEEAIRCHDKALELDPGYAMAWNNKGNSLHSLGRFEEALRCFAQALVLEPKDATAWNNKANSLDSLGRSEEALRCFEQALELDPLFVGAWYNKGVSLFSLGRDKEALCCFDKVIELDPHSAAGWGNKGLVLSSLDRYEEAIVCLEQAGEIDPWSSAIWNNRGLCLSRLGHDEEAMNCFFNAITLDEQNNAAWNNAGLQLDSRTGYEEAVISQAMLVHRFSPALDR